MPVISSILFNTCLSAGKDWWAKPSAGKNQRSYNETAGETLHFSCRKAHAILEEWFWVIDQLLMLCLALDVQEIYK